MINQCSDYMANEDRKQSDLTFEQLRRIGRKDTEVKMSKFDVGDRAKKVGGSYQATGTVVSAFKTLKGFERYVFEFDEPEGLLHIFGPNQLERE